MPELYLLRHAKSDWGDHRLADIDRPLSPRGVKAAAQMGAYLQDIAPPDLIWASNAVRVQQTVSGLRKAFPELPAPVTVPSIYGASYAGLLDLVRQARCDRLMLVGHNPGMEELATRLTRGSDGPGRAVMVRKYPTAALAEIVFDCQWGELDTGMAELKRFTRPKDL